MANYAVPALTQAGAGAVSGAGIGSALGPIGAGVGAGIGALAGLGSSIYQTWQTEQQSKEMQDMINQNYDKIIQSINKEYEKNMGGVGDVYSAGAKANKARTNQILGAEGLSGSPIMAALEREYGATSASNAGQQYTQLGQAKSNALLGAQSAYDTQNQQLGLAKQQAAQTNYNTALEMLGKSGGALGAMLTPNGTLDTKTYTNQLNDITLPNKINMGVNTQKAVN